jgi:hypothetical protein
MRDLISRLSALRRFDLAQNWHAGMPHYPSHPPYMRSLTKLHGDFVLENGASSASDAVSFGTHTGTHIDALCHYSLGGRLHGGGEVSRLQDWTDGIAQHGAETLPLLLQRGVLLDVARMVLSTPAPPLTRRFSNERRERRAYAWSAATSHWFAPDGASTGASRVNS